MLLRSGQLHVQNPDSLESNDGEHCVVPIALNPREDGDDSCLPDQCRQLIFDAGADAGVAIQFQLSVVVEDEWFS